MANNTEHGASFPRRRDHAPVAAIVLAAIVAVAGGAWVIADAIGDLKGEVARTAALIEGNARAIERNAEAIERNAEAIERNAEAIERNAEAIERNAEAMADLKGEVAHAVSLIEGNARAIADLKVEVARAAALIEGNARAIADVKAEVAHNAGQYAEHLREHGGLAAR